MYNSLTLSTWTRRSTESGFPFLPFTLLTDFEAFLMIICLVVGLDEFPVPWSKCLILNIGCSNKSLHQTSRHTLLKQEVFDLAELRVEELPEP